MNPTTTRQSCMHRVPRIFYRNYRSIKSFTSSYFRKIHTVIHVCSVTNTTYKYTHNYTTTRVLYLSHLFIVDRNYHSITSSMSHRMYPYIRNKFRSLYKSNTHIFDIEQSPPLTVATIATVATTTTTT